MKKSNYFKYAIGEILLVTVGILLALQLNNWNDLRKAKTQEIELVEKLLEDTRADSVFFNSRKVGMTNQIQSYDGITMMSRGESTDSLLNVEFNDSFAPFLVFGYQSNLLFNNPNSHDELHSKDIKNELRKYAATYHFVSTATQILNDKVINYGDPIIIKNPEVVFGKFGERNSKMSDMEYIYSNKEHIGVIQLFRGYNSNTLRQVNNLLELNYEFIDLLESYLKENR